MNGSKNIRILVKGTVIFLITSFLSTIAILLLHNFKIGILDYGKFPNYANTYQFSEFDPFLNKTRIGLARLHKILRNEEFLSYRNSQGSYIVISKTSDLQFECKGTCHCTGGGGGGGLINNPFSKSKHESNSNIVNNKDFNTRRFSTTFVKSLFFLISAMSTGMALKIAENYFNDECVLLNKRALIECPEDMIKAQIDQCQLAEDDEPPEFYEYYCTGHCLRNKFLKKERAFHAAYAFKCNDYRITGTVYVQSFKNFNYDIARHLFRKEYLHEFCRRISFFNLEKKYTHKGKRYAVDIPVNLCVATTYGSTTNIKCERRPYSGNSPKSDFEALLLDKRKKEKEGNN